jgi:hypothetical protein
MSWTKVRRFLVCVAPMLPLDDRADPTFSRTFPQRHPLDSRVAPEPRKKLKEADRLISKDGK